MAKESRYTFSRLFEGHRPGYPQAALAALAERMKDTDENRPRTPMSLPSGYVYFAQFIDHDLAKDDTDINAAGDKEPEETPNKRTPRLDLEILYRNRQGTFYETDDGLLKIGRTEASPATAQTPAVDSSFDDLPRLSSGWADILGPTQ